MNFRYKKLYGLYFIASLSYTIFGIMHLARDGGPCNGGLALFILGPAILLCTILMIFSFSFFINSYQNTVPVFLSAISLLIWTYCLLSFAGDDLAESFLFLGPFELFIIVTLFIEILTSKQKIHGGE